LTTGDRAKTANWGKNSGGRNHTGKKKLGLLAPTATKEKKKIDKAIKRGGQKS